MASITATRTNTVGSLYLSTLLSSPQLPDFLFLNSKRLTASYRILAECIHRWKFDFVNPTHGLFLFVRLAPDVVTVDEEKSYFDGLIAAGLKVSPGQLYKGVKGEFGWARIRFSFAEEVMKRAVARFNRIHERRR